MHLLFRDQIVLVMKLVYVKVSQQFILLPFWHGLSSSIVVFIQIAGFAVITECNENKYCLHLHPT
jgi:hypothetical protein